MLAKDEIAVLRDSCLFGTVGDQAVLLNIEDGNYFGLNATGAHLFSLIQQQRAGSELCRSLVEEFLVDELDAERQVLGFREELRRARLIHSVNTTNMVSDSVPNPNCDRERSYDPPALTRFGDVTQIVESGPRAGRPSGLLGSAKGWPARKSGMQRGSFTYSAYNLTFSCPWHLSELLPAQGPPDVIICPGDLRARVGDEPDVGFYKALPNEFFIYDPQVGAFLATGGNKIVVDLAPGADEHLLQLFVTGPALAHLLHQRGLLLLHASAVGSDDGCIAFAGKTSWGKSTTAAAFHDLGWDFVTDDMLALEISSNSVNALPGCTNIRLWPDAISHFGGSTDSLPLVHPALEKRTRKLNQRMTSQSAKVRRVHILAEGNTPAVEKLSPAQAFLEVVRHTEDDVLKTLLATKTAATHFRQCVKLVNTVSVRRLVRPLDLGNLAELERLIVQDLSVDY